MSKKSNHKSQQRMDIIKEMIMAMKKIIIKNIQNRMAFKNQIIKIMKKSHILKSIKMNYNKKLLRKISKMMIQNKKYNRRKFKKNSINQDRVLKNKIRKLFNKKL